MAGRNIKKNIPKPPEKITSFKEIDKIVTDMKDKFESLEPRQHIKVLKALGVGTEFFTCQHCGEVKRKDAFYSTTVPRYGRGIVSICKKCAEEIAMPTVNGTQQEPTKTSVDNALFYLDKPMLDSVWDSSVAEAAKGSGNAFGWYMKNIAMPQWYTYSYKNSDGYTGGMLTLDSMVDDALPKNQEIIEQFDKNKSDTLRLLGYLPFEKEKISDQPFLYSQLIGFLDASEEGNDDMMRISSIVSIVRGFLQASNIDDQVAQLSADPNNAQKNISTIRALQQMKNQIMQGITKLAEQSCISLKNSKHSVRGENTWSGKVAKIKDLNLREGQVNGFDIATCKSMQQIEEISDAAIMKQLQLDESEWSDMVATMREEIKKLRSERDSYQEINRLLLRENIDLKDYIDEKGILTPENLQNLRDIYSPFHGDYSGEEYETEGDIVDE